MWTNAWQENSSLVNGVHRVGHGIHQDKQVSPESVSFLNKTYLHHFCTFILPVQRGQGQLLFDILSLSGADEHHLRTFL